MSRSDAQSTRIDCPTVDCPGKLELRTDTVPVTVRCPKCKGIETVEVFARTRTLRWPVIPDMPRGGRPMSLGEILRDAGLVEGEDER